MNENSRVSRAETVFAERFSTAFRKKKGLSFLFPHQANHVLLNNDKKASVQITDERKAEFETLWRENAHQPLAGV